MWEDTDGLDPADFNPKTFFKLHGNLGGGAHGGGARGRSHDGLPMFQTPTETRSWTKRSSRRSSTERFVGPDVIAIRLETDTDVGRFMVDRWVQVWDR